MKHVAVVNARLALLLAPLLVRLLVAQAPPPSQASPPSPPPTYTVTDLGPLSVTAAPSGATALNATAQVTGFRFENFTTTLCGASGADQAFLWDNGAYTELGTLSGAASFGYAINNSGQIAGTSQICLNGGFSSQRAMIWQNGAMTNLGNPNDPSLYSEAFAINSAGDVGGYEIETDGYQHAIIWKGGTHAGATLLPGLPCNYPVCQASVLALNDLGQAAGWSIAGTGGHHPVIWSSSGQATDLGSFGPAGYNSHANALNDNGAAVGYSTIDAYTVHAFLWQNGTLQDLGAIPGANPYSTNLPPDNCSSAWGVNAKGDIVGISAYGTQAVTEGNGGRAFLYTNGAMYDLTSLQAPGTNWKLLKAAWGINDAGQIVGVGVDPSNSEHGFLLTPIITPTSTSVSPSVNPSVFGQQVSFTATVMPSSSSSLAPTGNVTFSDASTVLGTVALSSEVAVFNTAGLGAGSHTITAKYAGDNNFGSSTSAAFTQMVNQAATTTVLAVSPNPVNFGQTVTLTATVSAAAPGAGTPTGTVTFLDGATAVGTGTLNGAGTASFSTSSLAASNHSVTASYGGDTNFTSSVSTATSVSITVGAPAITSPSSGFSTTNSSVTIIGTGFPGAAVNIYDGTTKVGAGPADSAGNFSISIALAVGAHSLSATQSLNTVTSAASASVSVTIAPTPPVITTPTSGFNTSSPSVIVGGTGMPGASVAILDGTVVVGTATVSTAGSYSTAVTLAVGAHSLTATQTLNGITSAATAAVTLTVLLPPAVITLTETIHVTDMLSFPDVFDPEQIKVTDQVTVKIISSPTSILITAPGVTYGTAGSATVSVSSVGGTVIGNVTLSVDGAIPATLSLSNGSATFNLGVLKAGNHTLAANFAGQGAFTGSSAQSTLVVNQATPAITWTAPAAITYGTSLSSAHLNASTSVAGTFTYTPAAGTVLTAGSQTLTANFSPTDSADYMPAIASVTLQVNPANPTLNWANPAPIIYGTPLSGTQLNATASVSGTFTYSPGAGTVLNVGSQTLLATFTPGDTTNYKTATAGVTLQVNPATPTITWPTPAAITYGTPLSNTQLNAKAALAGALVPGTFAYNPPTGTVLSAGSQSLSAIFTPTDLINYTQATAKVTLKVNPATPTITWATPRAIIYGTLLSGTQLNATASMPGTFSYNPPTGTLLSAGSHVLSVLFTPIDSTDYMTATASVPIQVLCGLLLNVNPSSVSLGGSATATAQVFSCSDTTQTLTVKFSSKGPLASNGCTTANVAFTTQPFSVAPDTSQTVSFPFKVPSGSCPGTYTIIATTQLNGSTISTSTASLAVTGP